MKTKTRARILILAGMMLCLSGCQKADQQNSDSKKLYYTAMESGDYYEDWAKRLGEKAGAYGFEFQAGYAEMSVEAQDAQVKDAYSDGYSVILCGLVQPEIATEIKAVSAGTPIVFINNAPPEDQLEKDRYIYVASDESMAGQYQAEYILDKLGDKDEIYIALLKGPKQASGTVGRTQGLKETLKASGKNIHYVFEDYADWNETTAKEMITMFLNTGNPVDCVVANNDDMAPGAVAAFEEAGMDTSSVLFLGVDASVKGCEAIAAKRMDFSVYQSTSEQIAAAVEAADKLAEGRSIQELEGATEDGKYIFVPFEKVDAGNVAQYQ